MLGFRINNELDFVYGFIGCSVFGILFSFLGSFIFKFRDCGGFCSVSIWCGE